MKRARGLEVAASFFQGYVAGNNVDDVDSCLYVIDCGHTVDTTSFPSHRGALVGRVRLPFEGSCVLVEEGTWTEGGLVFVRPFVGVAGQAGHGSLHTFGVPLDVIDCRAKVDQVVAHLVPAAARLNKPFEAT